MQVSGYAIDWDELLIELRAAQAKMSKKNEHRIVLWKAEQALTAIRQALRESPRDVETPHGEAPRSV